MAKFCEHCGAQLEDDAKFCDSCGKPVESESAIDVAPPASINFAPPATNSAAKTTIQIFRKWRFVDFLYAANVFVDGIQIGKVSNGQTKIFDATPGVHKLQLKMNWSFFSGFLRSPEIDFRIERGDALKFNCDFNFGAFMTITGFFIWKALFCGFKVIKIEQAH